MKVLFLTKNNIYGNRNSGGNKCGGRNYDLLCQYYGTENVFVCLLSADNVDDIMCKKIDVSSKTINRYWNYIFLRDGYSKDNEKEVVKYIDDLNPDIIFFDGTMFGGILKKIRKKCKVIAFYHNIERHYTWTRIFHKSPICILRYLSSFYNEKIITLNADLRICLNTRDNRLLKRLYMKDADLLLPITLKDDFHQELIDNEKSNSVLFVGSKFMPNVKGIKWFVKNVAPKIDCKVVVVGKGMETLSDQLKGNNIEVVGGVESLEIYYQKADAVIMPIFVGDGMKVKTSEAMMYGKKIFATKEALEGYEIAEGIECCNSDIEFINAIEKFYNTYDKKFQEEVRKNFLHNYETENLYKKFSGFMKEKGY